MIIQQLQTIFNEASSKLITWDELSKYPVLTDIELIPFCIITRLPISDFRRLYFRVQINANDVTIPPIKNDCKKYISIYRGSLIYFNQRYRFGEQLTIMKNVTHSLSADEPGIFFVEYFN